ncbi:MAG: DUF421 domain-containing protein [candidate division Zixibacteria bacterium]|nr:DUF421 domain-containing protein [candidate division Zixibacteria bacterium]
MTNAVMGAGTLFSLVFITSALSHRFKKVENILAGTPTVLVHNGKFCVKNMNSELVSNEEFYGEMGKAGLEEISQVKWGILEDDGQFSFIPIKPEDKHTKAKPKEFSG